MHIANNIQGASAPTDGARPFDPADWLAHYVELGGGYTVNPDSVWLHWSLTISEAERHALQAHEMPLRCDMTKRDAVKSLLLASSPKEALSC
ncbi:hypothetical protein [Sphingobium fuliginis]|uniref:Uncharacterized protein n=1 Tax=Sphingobium fuliginis (strain ATCC 27551) TaxID=336203 RepID=A0A292Z8P0_SPHSA|nr:hypothetical protein [Sphingobium fuliginis]GAY19718.1 hypothetical protein SFOMI_0238 [Sphingobium fuliginis]